MTAFDARAVRASIRQKYHLRHVGGDTHIWNVRRLVELAGDPAPDMMLPDDIAELNGNWWFSPDGPAATPRRIAAHMRLAMEADLSHPIILCADGRWTECSALCEPLLSGEARSPTFASQRHPLPTT